MRPKRHVPLVIRVSAGVSRCSSVIHITTAPTATQVHRYGCL